MIRRALFVTALAAGLLAAPMQSAFAHEDFDWLIAVKTVDNPPPGCGGIADGNVVRVDNGASPSMDCRAAVKISQMAVGETVYTKSRDTAMFADNFWTVTNVATAAKEDIDETAAASLVAKVQGTTYTISLDAAPFVDLRDFRFQLGAHKTDPPPPGCGALVFGNILRGHNGAASEQSCAFNRKMAKIEIGDILHTHGGGDFWRRQYWEVTNIQTGQDEQPGTDDATFSAKFQGTHYTISANNIL